MAPSTRSKTALETEPDFHALPTFTKAKKTSGNATAILPKVTVTGEGEDKWTRLWHTLPLELKIEITKMVILADAEDDFRYNIAPLPETCNKRRLKSWGHDLILPGVFEDAAVQATCSTFFYEHSKFRQPIDLSLPYPHEQPILAVMRSMEPAFAARITDVQLIAIWSDRTRKTINVNGAVSFAKLFNAIPYWRPYRKSAFPIATQIVKDVKSKVMTSLPGEMSGKTVNPGVLALAGSNPNQFYHAPMSFDLILEPKELEKFNFTKARNALRWFQDLKKFGESVSVIGGGWVRNAEVLGAKVKLPRCFGMPDDIVGWMAKTYRQKSEFWPLTLYEGFNEVEAATYYSGIPLDMQFYEQAE